MAASFQDSPDVEQLVKKLIEKNKEFKHLQGAKIIGRFRFGTWNSKGKITLGQAKV
ncbi:putative metallopeptidase [Paenibacillus melissococcoides]|nr:putative metallopeptidase [Paenibacillus melissococcoides]